MKDYNVTCLITGKTDNIKMYALYDDKDNMIGWVFLHQSIKMEDIEATVKWNVKAKIGSNKPKQ